MKIILFTTFLSLSSLIPCLGQSGTPYNLLELGSYKVGFKDSVLFDTTAKYSAYGYTGDLLLFVQIWHSIESNSASDHLSFEDLRPLPSK